MHADVKEAMVLCHQKPYNNHILYSGHVFHNPTNVKFI